jgi:hypothetical protein
MTIWPTGSRRARGTLAPAALCTGIALLAAHALAQDQGQALQPDLVVAPSRQGSLRQLELALLLGARLRLTSKQTPRERLLPMLEKKRQTQ